MTNTTTNINTEFTGPLVMLFSPVRVSLPILKLTLESHARLQGNIHYVYFDDCEPEASAYLRAWARDRHNVTFLTMDGIPESTYSHVNHTWDHPTTHRIAQVRNAAIKYFGDVTHSPAPAFLFMVDADLVLPPGIVTHLVKQATITKGVDVVSEVFWTKWKVEEPYLPNVWDVQPYSFLGSDSVLRLRYPGLFEVSGLGACTLFKARILDGYEIQNVNFESVPGLNIWGEDRHMSVRLAAHGIGMYADTQQTPFHVYRESMVEEAEWWAHVQGYDVSYFRRNWLDDKWTEDIKSVLTAEPKRRIVAFCLPGEQFSSLWVNAWTAIVIHMAKKGIVAFPQFGYSSNVYMTRNSIWEALLNTGLDFEAVVWIDDDNLVTTDHIDKLLATLDNHPTAGIAAGWCWIKPEGFNSQVWMSFGKLQGDARTCLPARPYEVDQHPGDLIKADYTGFPIVAMRGSLLKTLSKTPFLPYLDSRLHGGMCGEDVAFCRHLTDNTDYKILVDRTVKVVHLKRLPAEPPGLEEPPLPVSVRELATESI